MYEPFPSKEEFLNSFENATEDPYDILSDGDFLSDEEYQKIYDKQVQKISEIYDSVIESRKEFEKKYS